MRPRIENPYDGPAFEIGSPRGTLLECYPASQRRLGSTRPPRGICAATTSAFSLGAASSATWTMLALEPNSPE
jgi:hypothetical protein